MCEEEESYQEFPETTPFHLPTQPGEGEPHSMDAVQNDLHFY